MKKVLQEHMAICIQHSIPPPSFSAISRVAAELGTARWVLVEADTGGRDGGQRVRLNLMEEDVVVTLKNASTEEGPGKVPEFVKKLVK